MIKTLARGNRRRAGDIANGHEQAAAEQAGLQMGEAAALQQARGQGVGDDRLQAVAHFEAHRAVVAGAEEQQAVVLAGGADGEPLEQTDGEILDRQPAQVADGDHGQLDGGLFAQGAAGVVDQRDVFRCQHGAAVGDEAGIGALRIEDFLDLFRSQRR